MPMTSKIPSLPSSLSPYSLTNTKFTNNGTYPPLKSSILTLKPLKFMNIYTKPTSKITSLAHMNPYPDRVIDNSSISSSGLVSLRLSSLVAEFRSLPEPIDRVKRLLDYASVLPGLGELTRSPENRVPGCAAQVWLEVAVDEVGRVRFRADSDSEITKGFCSCLIFLLDGSYPQDVLKVKAEDLADMNVGLPVRSRVNSWHNVLINMQEKTKSFLAEEVCELETLDTFLPLVVSADSIIDKGLCQGDQVSLSPSAINSKVKHTQEPQI